MTAATLTLTDFLLARIAEDEAVATAAREHEYLSAARDASPLRWSRDALGYGNIWTNSGRVLAECEAKRRIVELHETVVNHGKPDACGVCTQWDDYPWRVQCGRDPFPCDTLRALAAVYADHPEYRDEWRL